MKILVLTSSRADYGYYLPLLKKLKADTFFELKIAAFGTHVSEQYGNTVNAIIDDGFTVDYQIGTLLPNNDPESISKSMALTIEKFASVWQTEKNIDLVICLGDRYEMFAAVASSIPFNIPIAHLYGGDSTLGAIDDKFRHAITMMSKYHFTSLESSAKKVEQMIGTGDNVYTIGSLSIDNLAEIKLLNKVEFHNKFGIELNNPVLLTFHPETVAFNKNKEYINELIAALDNIDGQLIITMPNADTMGQIIREALIEFANRRKNTFAVESLGTVGYFSCIKHCKFVIGNSSSGITEVASFGKYVINLGNRQQGRPAGNNVIHCELERNKIIQAIKQIESLPALSCYNIYGDGKAAEKVINVLKNIKASHVQ